MILLVLNEKGGVGKTTLATAFSHAMVLRERAKVLLVDADPQGSVMKWAERRGLSDELPFTILAMPTSTIDRDIQPFAKDYDYIVIDAPPRSDDIARACLRAADAVLIPVTPSYYDVWATETTLALLRNVRAERSNPGERGGPEAGMVLNRVRENTRIERDVFEALAAFPDVPVLETRVHERTIHQQVTKTGQTVIEAQPMGDASQEATGVVNEVLAMMWRED